MDVTLIGLLKLLALVCKLRVLALVLLHNLGEGLSSETQYKILVFTDEATLSEELLLELINVNAADNPEVVVLIGKITLRIL